MGIVSAVLKSAFKERLAALRYRKTSYSQFGEDVHLKSFYDRLEFDLNIRVDRGCFVDIGAYRPIAQSNSYAFYRRGWQCINVDATPGSKLLFDKVRPRDINLEVAVGPAAGEATYFSFGSPSVWNTLSEEAAASAAAKTGIAPKRIPTKVQTLASILDRNDMVYPVEILSIDAEGYDIEILRSNDFSRHRPRIILVETHDATAGNIAAHPTVQFLAVHGYQLHSWINPNLMFVRNDSVLP